MIAPEARAARGERSVRARSPTPFRGRLGSRRRARTSAVSAAHNGSRCTLYHQSASGSMKSSKRAKPADIMSRGRELEIRGRLVASHGEVDGRRTRRLPYPRVMPATRPIQSMPPSDVDAKRDIALERNVAFLVIGARSALVAADQASFHSHSARKPRNGPSAAPPPCTVENSRGPSSHSVANRGTQPACSRRTVPASAAGKDGASNAPTISDSCAKPVSRPMARPTRGSNMARTDISHPSACNACKRLFSRRAWPAPKTPSRAAGASAANSDEGHAAAPFRGGENVRGLREKRHGPSRNFATAFINCSTRCGSTGFHQRPSRLSHWPTIAPSAVGKSEEPSPPSAPIRR